MNYTKEFKELIEMCQPIYIGTGNPNAKILIIGKECAIDQVNNEPQYRMEIACNAKEWELNMKNDISQNEVDNWFNNPSPKYNPIYPYKGQRFGKRSQKDDQVRGDGGTSSTWYNYQKLYNFITQRESDTINFHEKCFITEMNEITGNYSHEISEAERINSINRRIPLFKMPFFQQFPIVIVASGHYVRNYNIDLESIFGVRWESPTINVESNWFNIHYQNDGSPAKLVIHTNQLSMGITDELLKRLADICIDFIKKNKIEL